MSWDEDSCLKARRVSLKGCASRCAANHSDGLALSDPSHTSREQSEGTAEVDCGNNDPKKVAQPSGKAVIVKEQRNSLNERSTLYYGTTWKGSVDTHVPNSISQLPSSLIAPVLLKVAEGENLTLYEDFGRPNMVGKTRLNGQEASLAQCINGLFENMNNGNDARGLSHEYLTRTFLKIYQGAKCSLVHGRLKASLLYGCLGRLSLDAVFLKTDIGIRQKFVSLWAENYSLDVLSAAAEVVVGREVLVDSQFLKSRHQCDDACTKRTSKKNLEAFLGSYLLRNEDSPDSKKSSPACCWRRTMLRSMMLIYVLDKAKQMNMISQNLYQASSTIKSSLDFLRGFTALIHPSVGDIYRHLKPLDYHIYHNQYPLSEYSYNIDNLATDLRDGVRLTRLVELLLFPLGSRTTLEQEFTIAIPTGEMLATIVEGGESWVLSQRLKIPCMSRLQRISNVQVALGALHTIHGAGHIAEGLSAGEIVDGHREKTMTLLWVCTFSR